MPEIDRRHSLPEFVRRRLADSDEILIEAELYARRNTSFVDLRRRPLETRANEDGTVGLVGYATTWDTWYDVAGGAPYGWSETIVAGAANKALAERDDVRFLFDHEGIPMGRNKSATMGLSADDIGLLMDLPSLDVQRNAFASALASAIERGDVDEMSFAFRAVRQEWNEDYTERRILELRLYDVSAVTYPANTATIIGLRTNETMRQENSGYPLGLALAQAAAL